MKESLWCVVILVTLFLLYQNREQLPFETICLGGVGLLLMFAMGNVLKSSGGGMDDLDKLGFDFETLIKNPDNIQILIDLAITPSLIKDKTFLTHLYDVVVNKAIYVKQPNNKVNVEIDKTEIQEIALLVAKAVESGKCKSKKGFVLANISYPFEAKNILFLKDRSIKGVSDLVRHNIKLMLQNCS